MTENEEIERILYIGVGRSDLENEPHKIAKALSELMEYRAIGTVDECAEMQVQYNYLLTKIKKYEAIGTIEEFKVLKEKNVAKKPRFYAHNYYCTECGNLVGNNEFEWQRFLYCDKCGQKLDWQ